MDNPFQPAGAYTRRDLCGRRQEMKMLRRLRSRGQHRLILGERETGKTTLLNAFCAEESAPGLTPIYVDALPTEDEATFAWAFARGLFRALEWSSPLKTNIIRNLLPGLSRYLVGTEHGGDSPGPMPFNVDLDGVLEAPQRLARNRNLRATVVVDNVHQLYEHDRGDVRRYVRNAISEHARVHYILCGRVPSRLSSETNPFGQRKGSYRLRSMDPSKWVRFIGRTFERRQITLPDDWIRSWVDDWSAHTGSIAGIGRHLWYRSHGRTTFTDEDYRQAIDSLVREQNLRFESIWSSLTANQRRVLTGIVLEGRDQALHSGSFLHRYRLSSASSASRARDAVHKRGWITDRGGSWRMTVPLFERWIRDRYQTVKNP